MMDFMIVSEESKILILKWKNSTEFLNDDKFKVEAIKLEKVIKQSRSKYVIVDMCDFKYNLGQEILAWRAKNIITTYNKIGVKKFAFISEEKSVNQDNPENIFVTKYFKTAGGARV